jgi:hypothetical protein
MGAKKAGNLIKEIEAKSAGITTERVWNCQSRAGVPPAPAANALGRRDACPTFAVRYKNIMQVYFRAVA